MRNSWRQLSTLGRIGVIIVALVVLWWAFLALNVLLGSSGHAGGVG